MFGEFKQLLLWHSVGNLSHTSKLHVPHVQWSHSWAEYWLIEMLASTTEIAIKREKCLKKKRRRRKQCWERFCFKYFVSFRYMFHPFSCTYPVLAAWEAPMANLGWSVNLACISLDCGRRLECLERTNTGRTHKSHSKMVQIKTQDLLSVRQEGGNHHSVQTISLFFTYNLL